MADLSSVDVPTGTPLTKLFRCLCWQNCILSNFNRQKFNFSSSDFGGSQPVRRRQISVVSDLRLKCLYTFPVFKSVLKCMAHYSRQELNDELSVCSQISTWLPLVCIKESAGIAEAGVGRGSGKKMATPPKQKFYANPHPLIPLPSILCVSPQSCVADK